MPKEKPPTKRETQRLLPHDADEEIKRYGTFGYREGIHEYGIVAPVPMALM